MSLSDTRIRNVWVIVLFLLVAVSGCARASEPGEDGTPDDSTLRLTSSAFEDDGLVPPLYTCDGEDISPPLTWAEAPEGTAIFALIMDDPDAPLRVWVHWVVYNIPADVLSFAEALPPDVALDDGTVQGLNSWDRSGYGGPCPPSGTHHYVFTLYALDTSLNLPPAETGKQEVLDAIEGHVLARTTLTGLYRRQ